MTVTSINRKVSGREVRRHQADTVQLLEDQMIPSLAVALENLTIAQKRIEALEAWRNRHFWERLVWLARGK